MMRSSPADLNSTPGAGCGAGSAAMAMSAAIFGVAALASCDQPACSRTLTKRRRVPESPASSPKSGASCVQATITSSAPPSAAWNAPASLRQSWWCTVSGSPAFSAAPSAFASSATVRLQLQTLSVFPSRFIVFRLFRFLALGRGLRRGFALLEDQASGLIERREHLVGNRLADGPVARIGLVGIGHVEVRIAEELLQRQAAQRVLDLRVHEAGEVRLRRELVHRRQHRGIAGVFFLRQVLRFGFEPGPARKKFFLVLRHG